MNTILVRETTDAKLYRPLDFAWLEISNRCNLKCLHCYARSSPLESARGLMALGDWFAVMRDLRMLQCERIQIIGGEPTIHPEFREIISEAVNLGFTFIEVYTNATRLGEQLCEFLAMHGVSVAFSFYSTLPDIHDMITTVPGSWERTVAGIKAALSAKLPVRAGVIEMPANKYHVDEAIVFLRSIGVSNISVDREREVGRASGEIDTAQNYSELCGRCGDGSISIDSNGAISPCVFSHQSAIGDHTTGIRDAIESDRLKVFRNLLTDAHRETNCTPSCQPHDCTPADGGGPCFPSSCDPNICGPISCPPRDISAVEQLVVTESCSPEDRCSPQACSPQVGGPPGCVPHQKCAPQNFPCVPRG